MSQPNLKDLLYGEMRAKQGMEDLRSSLIQHLRTLKDLSRLAQHPIQLEHLTLMFQNQVSIIRHCNNVLGNDMNAGLE